MTSFFMPAVSGRRATLPGSVPATQAAVTWVRAAAQPAAKARAQTAAAQEPVDTALLAEILGPLARRAEGLQRFATDYRALARLPEPILAPSSLDQFARDLTQLFAQRWPATTLTLDIGAVEQWRMDRDQLHQAVWALLNNAAEATSTTSEPRVSLSIEREEVMSRSVPLNGNHEPWSSRE